MYGNRNCRVCTLVLGAVLCVTGCTGADHSNTSKQAATELPPLITSADSDESEAVSENDTKPQEEADLPAFQGKATQWKLPEELGSVQVIRYYDGCVYLLGQYQNEDELTKSVLFRAAVQPEPQFSQLFSGDAAENMQGMVDFTILSDGTICGLICENSTAVPYDDPDFDPNEFDWESYYENYSTQYRLVWYNADGTVSRKMGLSALLDMDESTKQTLVYTSVRSDASDRVYLTATVDEKDYLMALDGNGNLCAVQGVNENTLQLTPVYQWVCSGESGMLLWEKQADNAMCLSHVIVTDGALWRTPITAAPQMTEKTMLAESAEKEVCYCFWDTLGIYQVADKNTEPILLYSWKELGVSPEDIDRALLLPAQQVLFAVYSAQGALSVQLITPSETESEKQTGTSDTAPDPGTETVPVATPVNFS